MIELRILGGLDLSGVDANAARELLAQPRPTALLVYLVLARPGQFHRRDHLVGLFWAESDQEHARSNLRKLIHVLRHHLGDDLIEARGDEDLRIAPSRVRCDAVECEEAIQKQHYARALELYSGALLPGFILTGAPGLKSWLELARRNLTRDATKAAVSIAQLYLNDAELTKAGDVLRLITRIEPELDDEHQLRKLLKLLDRLDDRAAAIRLYEDFKERVWRDFHVLPSPETRSVIEAIRAR